MRAARAITAAMLLGTLLAGTASAQYRRRAPAPAPTPDPVPDRVMAGDLAAGTKLAAPTAPAGALVPDAAGAPSRAMIDKLPIRPLEEGEAFFDRQPGLFFTSLAAGQVFVPYVNHRDDGATRVYYEAFGVYDGRRRAAMAVPEGARVLAVSPDGGRVAMTWTSAAEKAEEDDALGVYAVGMEEARPVKSWRPYATLGDGQRSITWAAFVDGEHLLTSDGYDLALWDIASAKAVWHMPGIWRCRPAVSANGKQVAAMIGPVTWILDSRTGQALARMEGELRDVSSLAFRPDGKQLAAILADRAVAWDAATGATVSDLAMNVPSAGTTGEFVADQYLLVNGRYLLDLARRVVLWEYIPETRGVGGEFGGEYWYSITRESDGSRVLMHVALPHESAQHVAEGLDAGLLVAVKPGTKVSLDMKLDGDPADRDRAVKSLTAQLKSNGIDVADGQKVHLVVSSSEGDMRELDYGTGPAAIHVRVPEDRVRLAFEVDGLTAWESTRTSGPPPATAAGDEQAVQQALAKDRARLRFQAVEQVTLPKYVGYPHKKSRFFGRSVLTDSGPKWAGPEDDTAGQEQGPGPVDRLKLKR